MANVISLNQPYVNVGLDDIQLTIPATGLYNVHFEVTENPPSGLVVVVKKNASTIFTAPAVASSQSAMQFKFPFQASATDVIDVVLSSSQAIDAALNNVKSIISIGQGV